MISSVALVDVSLIEEGSLLDLYDDEYAGDFEHIDIDKPFEVVRIYPAEEEIEFENEDGATIFFPYEHKVRVKQD